MDAKARRVMPGKVDAALAAFEKEAAWPCSFIAKLYTNSLPGLARRAAFAQSMGDVAAVCCAIDRYLLAEGRLPETLTVLVPKYLPRLPHDVVTGDPLRYVIHAPDDYSVYAVGWDGKDDDGRYDGSGEGDWGWPNTIIIPKFTL